MLFRGPQVMILDGIILGSRIPGGEPLNAVVVDILAGSGRCLSHPGACC